MMLAASLWACCIVILVVSVLTWDAGASPLGGADDESPPTLPPLTDEAIEPISGVVEAAAKAKAKKPTRRPTTKPPTTKRPTNAPTPSHSPTVKPTTAPTFPITPAPTTTPLVCWVVGAGPVREAAKGENSILCQIPFSYQKKKGGNVTPLDYCASITKLPPKQAFDDKWKNGTDLWCPIQNVPLYQPFSKSFALQWGFCQCNRPRPTEASCTVRAGVDPNALLAWNKGFQIASPGQACVFPFQWEGRTYFECADKVAGDPVKEFGWCFTDESTKTYGACSCSRTPPPTTVSPTPRPTTKAPTPKPGTPTTLAPSRSPTTLTPTRLPTASPTLSNIGIRLDLLITLSDLFLASTFPLETRSPTLPTPSPHAFTPTPAPALVLGPVVYTGGPTAKPTPKPTPFSINFLRGSASLNAERSDVPSDPSEARVINLGQFPTRDELAAGLRCLLLRFLLTSVRSGGPIDVQFSPTCFINNTISNNDTCSTWPQLVRVVVALDQGDDQLLALNDAISGLANPDNNLYLPGLWLHGTVIYRPFSSPPPSPTNPEVAVASLTAEEDDDEGAVDTDPLPGGYDDASNSKKPTSRPTIKSTTSSPIVTPSPTLAPVTLNPTRQPTNAPTRRPTAPPTSSPTAPTAVMSVRPPRIVHLTIPELSDPAAEFGCAAVYLNVSILPATDNPTPMPSAAPTPSTGNVVPSDSGGNSTALSGGAVAGAVIGSLLGVLALFLVGFCFVKRRREEDAKFYGDRNSLALHPLNPEKGGRGGGSGGFNNPDDYSWQAWWNWAMNGFSSGPVVYGAEATSSSGTTRRTVGAAHVSSHSSGKDGLGSVVHSNFSRHATNPAAIASPHSQDRGASPKSNFTDATTNSEFAIDLNQLKLGKVIGTGANGRIFSAKYCGSAVAVKELFSHDFGDGEDGGQAKNNAAEILFREFAHLRLLKHPHVIQLFGLAVARSAETGAPRYLLVMELAETSLDKMLHRREQDKANWLVANSAAATANAAEGGDNPSTPRRDAPNGDSATSAASSGMEARLNKQHSSSTDAKVTTSTAWTPEDHFNWALNICTQIASGLAFVHDRGLIHFDVKPHNVLLDKADMAKLCDLGISKLVTDQKGRDLTLTSPARAGTPSYMAPELLKGETSRIGTPVDVYAFSIVLWQVFHLAPPHSRDWSVAQLFDAVMNKGHRPSIDDNAFLNVSELKTLLIECWDEDPAKRPTFENVVARLQAIHDARQEKNDAEGNKDEDGTAPGLAAAASPSTLTKEIEAVVYQPGDKVKVYSAAVRGLVPGVIQSSTAAGGKKKKSSTRYYDVKLEDGSTILGVNGAEIIPINAKREETKIGTALLLQVRGLNQTSTLSDVAGALAVARSMKRPRDRRGSLQTEDSAGTASGRGSPTNGRLLNANLAAARAKSKLAAGGRFWKNRFSSHATDGGANAGASLAARDDDASSVATAEEQGSSGGGGTSNNSPRFASGTQTSSGGIPAPRTPSRHGNSDLHALPAITPFSFRFLPPGGEGAAEAGGGGAMDKKNVSMTFRFEGNVLNLQGFLVTEEGGRSGGTGGAGSHSTTSSSAVLSSSQKSDGSPPLPTPALSPNAAAAASSASAEHWKGNLVKIAELGRGASGNVYSALHTSTFKIVAVKEVNFTDRAARHQTARELKALSNFSSPYVIRMYDSYFDMERSCIVMVLEYVNGGSLQDLIEVSNRTVGFVSEKVLKKVAHDVMQAFVECHTRHHTAHLDVKPSNILLGLQGYAQLADFGLAKKLDPDADSAAVAMTFVGTTKYMSPERLKGAPYSFPADVWGLGMSLLAAGLGRYPFDDLHPGKGEPGLYWSLLERLEKPGSIPDLPSQYYSEEARSFIRKCLNLEASQRPVPAAALAEDPWFSEFRTGEGAEAAGEPLESSRFPSDATRIVLNEVSDAVVNRLRNVANGGESTTVVTIDSTLVHNLAEQLGVRESEVRASLNSAAAKVKVSLSDTIASGGSGRSARRLSVTEMSPPSRGSLERTHSSFDDTQTSSKSLLGFLRRPTPPQPPPTSPTKNPQQQRQSQQTEEETTQGAQDEGEEEGAEPPPLELQPL